MKDRSLASIVKEGGIGWQLVYFWFLRFCLAGLKSRYKKT